MTSPHALLLHRLVLLLEQKKLVKMVDVDHEISLLLAEIPRVATKEGDQYTVKFKVLFEDYKVYIFLFIFFYFFFYYDLFLFCFFLFLLNSFFSSFLIPSQILFSPLPFLYPQINFLSKNKPKQSKTKIPQKQLANTLESLCGTLKAAKRKGQCAYQPQLLLQGMSDNVDITFPVSEVDK